MGSSAPDCLSRGVRPEVIRLAARYNELYGEEDAPLNDFSTMMESELSGSLLDGIKHLLESLPPKSHWDLKEHAGPTLFWGLPSPREDDRPPQRLR